MVSRYYHKSYPMHCISGWLLSLLTLGPDNLNNRQHISFFRELEPGCSCFLNANDKLYIAEN